MMAEHRPESKIFRVVVLILLWIITAWSKPSERRASFKAYVIGLFRSNKTKCAFPIIERELEKSTVRILDHRSVSWLMSGESDR